MTHFTMSRALKSAVAAGALLSLGGCMYGGSGYYGDGYVNNHGYDCDPYAPFDDYYACDYGYGFANIGYGGGWYDHYYYPGYGIYIFDRGGRRHAMRDNHRRHWARQRAEYGGHHARDRNLNPQRRAGRRDRRYDRRDATRDQRRSDRGVNTGTRDDRGDRPRTRAVEQPQVRQQRAAPPAETSRPPQPKRPRPSPRTSRNGRERLNDD